MSEKITSVTVVLEDGTVHTASNFEEIDVKDIVDATELIHGNTVEETPAAVEAPVEEVAPAAE